MTPLRLVCPACGRSYPVTRSTPWCECGGVMDLDFTPARLDIVSSDFSFWRYSGVLPVGKPITLGEPVTPVVQLAWGGRIIDAKLEYLLPTGSFKDRGAAVFVAALNDAGIRQFMEDSSGNAGASMAAYAARAGLDCDIYCPSSASPSKLIQIERAGATIHRIEGPREATTAAVVNRASEVFYASHNWHPLFLHGTKTMAYEIAEQYHWQPPDHIVAPTGGGSVLIGLHLGFGEMIRLGRIARMPRFHAVQAAACAPLLDQPVNPKPSLAEGILTARPPRLQRLKEVIDRAVKVSEDEILEGFRSLSRMGLNAEPTSAVVLPGLHKLNLPTSDSVLVILTGSGLKTGVR